MRNDRAENRDAVEKWKVEARQHDDAGRIVGAGDAIGALQEEANQSRDRDVEAQPDDDLVGAKPRDDEGHREAKEGPGRSSSNVAKRRARGRRGTSTATSAPASIIDSRPKLTRPPMRLTRPPIAASKYRRRRQHRRMEEEVDHARRSRAGPAKADLRDGENHDGALEDLDDLDRHVAEQLDLGARRRQRAEQDGGDGDADRGIAPEHRDRDAGEAIARREARDEAMNETQDMNAAREAADQAGGDHHAQKRGGQRRFRPRG